MDNINIEINVEKPEFVVIGDPHFSNQTPSCRIDNYSETCLEKLCFVLDYCIKNIIQLVIFEGDFFHKQQIPIFYISKLILVLNKKRNEFRVRNGKDMTIVSIIGNHDLPFENYKFIERSPIFLMFETGSLQHFNYIKLISNKGKDTHLSLFDYNTEIKKSCFDDECCIAHCFFDFAFAKDSPSEKDRISEEDAKNLGYKVYFFGHDHNFYGITKKDEYYVIRSGSLLRNSSHIQQINRITCFYHVKHYDKYEFEKVLVECCKPSENVFSKESITKPKKIVVEESTKERISEIILQLSEEKEENNSAQSIFDKIIKERCVSEEVKSVLTRYLKMENIV